MKKKRIAVPAQVKRELMIECGYKCSMNRCEREIALEIHHIDSDPSNNDPENLIVFCSGHHSQADKGIIDKLTCKALKTSLKETYLLQGKPIELKSRSDFFNATRNSLIESTELRAIFVGPTFIRPQFLIDIRNDKRATIDLDAYFFSFIENNYSRVIFRNNLRFKQKITEYLPEVKQQRRYQIETLRMLEEIKTSERFKNFSFCCVDSGFYKIDFVFDDSLITSSRETFNKPINSALKYINKEEIERAKVNFDNIFDNSYQGKDIEFENLKAYINNLFE